MITIFSNRDVFSKELLVILQPQGFTPQQIKTVKYFELSKIDENFIPKIVFFDLSENIVNILQAAQKSFSVWGEHIRLIGIGQPADVSSIMKLIKAGIKDFAAYPFDANEIKGFFNQMLKEPFKTSSNGESGKVIVFYSPKGGTGVTLITVNTAIALAEKGSKKVIVFDPSAQCGDAATYLNLAPQYTIRDILDNHSLLDKSFLEGTFVSHSTGIKILAAPKDDQEPPTSNHLNTMKYVLNLLRGLFDYVLIDGGALDSSLLQYLMADSNVIFLVGNPDVVSIKGLIAFHNKLLRQSFEPSKIKVLINRFNSKSQIDAREFEKKTKHPIAMYLPNNYAVCIEAVNSGVPLKEIQSKADLTKKISELGDLITQLTAKEAKEVLS